MMSVMLDKLNLLNIYKDLVSEVYWNLLQQIQIWTPERNYRANCIGYASPSQW